MGASTETEEGKEGTRTLALAEVIDSVTNLAGDGVNGLAADACRSSTRGGVAWAAAAAVLVHLRFELERKGVLTIFVNVCFAADESHQVGSATVEQAGWRGEGRSK